MPEILSTVGNPHLIFWLFWETDAAALQWAKLLIQLSIVDADLQMLLSGRGSSLSKPLLYILRTEPGTFCVESLSFPVFVLNNIDNLTAIAARQMVRFQV